MPKGLECCVYDPNATVTVSKAFQKHILTTPCKPRQCVSEIIIKKHRRPTTLDVPNNCRKIKDGCGTITLTRKKPAVVYV